VGNPRLRAFAWDLHGAEASRMQAALLPNPELDVEVEEFGGTGGRSGFDSSETSIRIGQLIELAQKRSKRVQLATLEKQLTEWDYQSKRLDVMNEVAGAFVDVLAAQERLALSEELARVAGETHLAVTRRVEAGKDSPLRQTKSKVALSTMRVQTERAARALETARIRLAATWGATVAAFEAAAGAFYEVTSVPDANELTERIWQNPDVARQPVERQERLAALKLEKARAASDPMITGGVQRFEEGRDTAFVMGLSIPIPVFNRNQGGIRRAMYAIEKGEEQRRAVEIAVRTALSEAAGRLSAGFAEATVLRGDVLPGAQSAFDAATEGYHEGKFDYLDVLDAQRTLFEAKGQYIDSVAAYHKARADVERLIGGRVESMNDVAESQTEKDK
jgi:cobalt-zinc-cadmium efflux system outer membrane protein